MKRTASTVAPPFQTEQEFPSRDAEEALHVEAVIAAAAPSPELPAAPVSDVSRKWPVPPSDGEAPLSGAPVTGSKPLPRDGPPAGNHPVPKLTDPPNSRKNQGLRPGVTFYTYRYYDPVTGRWPSRDPIEEEGGINLYGFVYNNPFGWLDIIGREPTEYVGDNGMFVVGPARVDDAFAQGRADVAFNNPLISVSGYDVDYFPDETEECENIKLIQVISYAGTGPNYGPELDNRGKNKKTSPGYRESGGDPSTTEVRNGIFDAPMYRGAKPLEKTGRPAGKGTFYLEVCAVCCPDTESEWILGCVRFDFDGKTGRVTPRVGGSNKNLEGGFEAPALSKPTRHYKNGRWK